MKIRYVYVNLRLHLDGGIRKIRYVYVKISYPIKYDVIFNGIWYPCILYQIS